MHDPAGVGLRVRFRASKVPRRVARPCRRRAARKTRARLCARLRMRFRAYKAPRLHGSGGGRIASADTDYGSLRFSHCLASGLGGERGGGGGRRRTHRRAIGAIFGVLLRPLREQGPLVFPLGKAKTLLAEGALIRSKTPKIVPIARRCVRFSFPKT